MIIDGSQGEGGGQIVRTSLALAGLVGCPVELVNIRRGRKRPGLNPQHLTAVRAMAAITRAEVVGAELGSSHLIFKPQALVGGDYEFDVSALTSSAGSVSLVLQAVAPALCAAQEVSHLVVKGGTHVPWSPPTTYLETVFLPALERLGLDVKMATRRWGWFPKGGGLIRADFSPAARVMPLCLEERGELKQVECLSVISNLPPSIAERQRGQLRKRLRRKGLSASCVIYQAPSHGTGSFVFILARYEFSVAGFGALGRRGKPAETVADEAFIEFWTHHTSGAAVDKYLADQIVGYLGQADGSSTLTTSEITPHLLTNIWVIERFLPVRVHIDGRLGQPGLVTVER